jgi:ribonuclease P protein component
MEHANLSSGSASTPAAATLRRGERLRARKVIESLFAGGRSGFVHPFRYVYSLDEQGDAPTSVLFSVPKRNHKRAVKRNLLKRRSREAWRLNKSALTGAVPQGKSLHVALVYSTKDIEDYRVIEDAIKKIIDRLGAFAAGRR